MDSTRFDDLTRLLSDARSRRQTLAALALGGFGIALKEEETAAGPGCKNVGKKCKKKKDCCSGVCKGKKGKKKCKAHDTGGCVAGPDSCLEQVPCTTSTGADGECFITTGNAGYCAADGVCVLCTKDADCRVFFGQKAACIFCATCDETGGAACVGPDSDEPE